ncbi:MAG: nucleotide exchange factor GrpE [Hyphomicrobiales bacterium]|jgi:molecular chaperone GrpE|nr:nucleotide exchange factor GrpE [Hyphomicrobiales bacterium]
MSSNQDKKINQETKKHSKESSIEKNEKSSIEDNEDESAINLDKNDEGHTKEISLQEQLDEANDRVLRMAAEMENLRKRSFREKEDAIKYSTTKFSRDIITVADDLERALESTKDADLQQDQNTKNLIEGIEITMKSLKQILNRNGIERFDPLGEKFDPTQHEAMFEIPDKEKENGIIVHLVEPGYRISDRILRPARVGVSKSNTQKNS